METKENKNTISFHIDSYPDEILKLEKGFFWYKGKKIKDIKKAYERFCKWLESSEKNINLNQ